MKTSAILVTMATAALLAACGDTSEHRAGSGALGGAAAGAVVGGPVGAVVGGAGGAVAGATMDEGVEDKAPRVAERIENKLSGDSSTTSRHAAMSRGEVRNVQQALRDNGQQVAVDGIWGPRTEGAVREFQRSKGMDATGRVDHQTMAALGVDNRGMAGSSTSRTGTGTGTGTTTGNTAAPMDDAPANSSIGTGTGAVGQSTEGAGGSDKVQR